MDDMAIILQRLDKMQESIDGLRGELRADMQENNESLRAEMQENNKGLRAEMREMREELRTEMCEMNEALRTDMRTEMQEMREELRTEMREANETLRTELTQRMDNMEYGLGQEIQAVYEIAQRNAEDIRQLMPYKSRLVNVCTMADRVEKLEECQKATTGVVASHSDAIRRLESRLA